RWDLGELLLLLSLALVCRCKKRVPPCFIPTDCRPPCCRACLLGFTLAQCLSAAHRRWPPVLILRITLLRYVPCLVEVQHYLMVRSLLLIGLAAIYRGPIFPMDCVVLRQGRYQSRQGSGVRFQLACSWISFITS